MSIRIKMLVPWYDFHERDHWQHKQRYFYEIGFSFDLLTKKGTDPKQGPTSLRVAFLFHNHKNSNWKRQLSLTQRVSPALMASLIDDDRLTFGYCMQQELVEKAKAVLRSGRQVSAVFPSQATRIVFQDTLTNDVTLSSSSGLDCRSLFVLQSQESQQLHC